MPRLVIEAPVIVGADRLAPRNSPDKGSKHWHAATFPAATFPTATFPLLRWTDDEGIGAATPVARLTDTVSPRAWRWNTQEIPRRSDPQPKT